MGMLLVEPLRTPRRRTTADCWTRCGLPRANGQWEPATAVLGVHRHAAQPDREGGRGDRLRSQFGPRPRRVLLAIIARDQRAQSEDGQTSRRAGLHGKAGATPRSPHSPHTGERNGRFTAASGRRHGSRRRLGQAVVTEFLATGAAVVAVDIPGERLDAGQRPTMCTLSAPNSPTPPRPPRRGRPSTRSAPRHPGHPGRGFQPSSLADLTEDIWNAMIDSNVASVVWSAREAAAVPGRGRRIDRHRRLQDRALRRPPWPTPPARPPSSGSPNCSQKNCGPRRSASTRCSRR